MNAPQMILRMVQEQPEAVAVRTPTGSLTYGELGARALRRSGALRRAGASRDHPVGLACDRDLDGIVALVGILLSGAAYVYLDPAWPIERLRHVATECRLRLQTGPAHLDLGLTTVDDDGPVPTDVAANRPDDLCYVIYTSGSTGVPKGVAVEHGGVANMSRELARVFGVGPGSRMLQFAAWSWDAAVCEILVALTSGATLVISPESVRRGGEALAGFLREQAVTVATLTPSLLAALPHGSLPELSTVVAVGEACPPELVDRWAPGRALFNGYGPTEATVAVSVGRCRAGEPVTIGRPLPGVLTRIVPSAHASTVDEAGPASAVVDGELWVGGVGLARGYVGGSGEAFVLDPDGRRWYRTGDLVRARPDGRLEYRGRLDDQVQVHGHRVELGEITAALRRHPGVRAVAVVVTGGRLVAHVVPADPGLRPAQVRDGAAEWLPSYLLPEVRIVDQLPLTAHGKLDRSALRAAAPPVDSTLSQVVDRIRFVLESGDVGPDDDLFDLGGHSLLAAQLAVDLTARFGVPVTAAQVSTLRTGARLAALIEPPALAGRPT